MPFPIPDSLVNSCRHAPETMDWLSRLPGVIADAQNRWRLELDDPFDGDEVSCSWVALAKRKDGSDAVLKIGMPHMEGQHELEGLLFWEGDHCVRVLDYIDKPRVMLLERCIPGTPLRRLPEEEQDEVITTLLKKIWRLPEEPHPFRTLTHVAALWKTETLQDEEKWVDPALTRKGLEVLEDLVQQTKESVLLAFDLHAGNVLKAQRQPWLMIDPKPFIGDPAYDATQHLFNCKSRLFANPEGTIRRIADLLEVDYERVRLWMFARAAAEPRTRWEDGELLDFAQRIAP